MTKRKQFIVISYEANPENAKPYRVFGIFRSYNKAKSFAAGYTDWYEIVEYRSWVWLNKK